MLRQKGWKIRQRRKQTMKDMSRLPIYKIKRYWKPEEKLFHRQMGLEGTDALAMSFLGAKIVIPKLIKSQAARKPVRNVCRVTYTVGN